MSALPVDLDGPPRRTVLEALAPLLRGVLLLAAVLLAWISLHAFESLGTPASLELSSGKDGLTYLCFFVLAAAAVLLAGSRGLAALRALGTGPMLALGGWLVVTSLISDDPGTSLKRLVLTGLVVTLAASPMLLADSQTQLARLLATAMTIVLVLCYGGVLLVPDLAVHQATDLGEPLLAGDWRGTFSHKNDAAAVLSLFVFLGLFVARSGARAWGFGLAGAALLFMLFAGGKSALALVGLTLAIVALARRCGSNRLRVAVLLAPALVLNMVGVGTVLLPALAAVVHALPVDASFTGRTDVWAFAIDNLPGHLLFGHGFEAFWNTASTRFGGEDDGWAATAAHAHNGYLDAVVNTGLPGLALVLLAFVVQPLRDLFAAERRAADPALLTMLQQIWLFTISLSAMETIFFDRTGPSWFTFLFAVFGLRYAASFRLRRGELA